MILAACGGGSPPEGRGEPWPAADELFHGDARFLGADGAYTVDLGGDRILWLFGDSFVARTPGRSDDAHFLRNSVALQTGRDPSGAFLRYHYRTDDAGEARSFFPEPDASHWVWPASGIRLDDRAILFAAVLRQEGPPGPDAFAGEGSVAYVVTDPDADPSSWELRPALMPARAREIELGEAVFARGEHVYVLGTMEPRHRVVLARFARTAVHEGDLTRPEWYCGARFSAACDPQVVIDPGLPEFSVHLDPVLGWVFVGTSGYGPAALAWRTAPAPQGPWSDIGDVYRPPESHLPDGFVYAGKAHPELDGHGALVATYVPSSFGELPDETWRRLRLYFPHVVRLWPR